MAAHQCAAGQPLRTSVSSVISFFSFFLVYRLPFPFVLNKISRLIILLTELLWLLLAHILEHMASREIILILDIRGALRCYCYQKFSS